MNIKILKFLKILIPIVLISIIILISYNTYKDIAEKTKIVPIMVIPNNASLILQVNSIEKLKESLSKNKLIENLKSIDNFKKFLKNSEKIYEFIIDNNNYFRHEQLFVSVHNIDNNVFSLYTFNYNEEYTQNKILEIFSNEIKQINTKQEIYFCGKSKNFYGFYEDLMFISINKNLILEAQKTANNQSNNLLNNNGFNKSYKSLNSSSDINLIVNYNNIFKLNNNVTTNNPSLDNFYDWTSLDISMDDNLILGNSFSSHDNSKTNLINSLYNQKSTNSNILKIAPENTNLIFYLSFNNFILFNTNISKVLKQNKYYNQLQNNKEQIFNQYAFDYNNFKNEINSEVGLFNNSYELTNEEKFIFFNVKQSSNAISLIQPLIKKTSSYNNLTINEIIDSNFTYNLFGDLFKSKNKYFTIIDNFFIFNESKDNLKKIIDSYNLNNTLNNEKGFKKLNSIISNKANLYLYVKPTKAISYAKKLFSIKENMHINIDSLETIVGFSLNINTSENGSVHNFAILDDIQFSKGINKLWSYSHDKTIVMNPQFIDNHFTNTKMILFQDDNNILSAINDKGKKMWEININDKIIGEISFIDIYNNNKYQALFNTEKFLYLIDRNGKLVNGFPKKLPSETNLGHSLFDYDNEKKYRIMIVGKDNYLYNLDKKGNKIDGWLYKKTLNPLTQKPEHFVVNNKDYILNATNNNSIRLLARNGSDRQVFKDIPFFKTKFKINLQGEIYAITLDNKLWIANVDGISKSISIPITSNNSIIQSHYDGYYFSNNETLIYIDVYDDNNQKIQYLDSKIKNIINYEDFLIVLTEKMIYLFENHKIVKGFPLDSDGYFNISDINFNKKPDLTNINEGIVNNIELIN